MTFTPDVVSLSPNRSPGQPSGKKVVVHATRSGISMNPSEFPGTLNHFANPASQVSAHGLVGRDGRIARIVPDSQTAWHAGIHNPDMWGWELEQGVGSDGFTIKQMESWALVARYYVEEFGVAPQHITDISKSGFIGHDETPQGVAVGKSDPGSGFMWVAFISSLEGDVTNDELEAALNKLRQDATNADAKLRSDLTKLRADATGADIAIRGRLDALEASPGSPTHTHMVPAHRTEES